jgi:hypothetical protein
MPVLFIRYEAADEGIADADAGTPPAPPPLDLLGSYGIAR